MPWNVSMKAKTLALAGCLLCTLLLARGASTASAQAGWPTLDRLSHEGGWITAADVEADRVYVARGRELVILDGSQAGTMSELGRSVALADELFSVDVQDGLALVGGTGRVWTLDAVDPAGPRVLGSWRVGERMGPRGLERTRVRQAGNGRAVVLHGGKLTLLDVSAPALPLVLGELEDPSLAADGVRLVATDSGRLFVHGRMAGGSAGRYELRAYDITGPAAPVLLGAVSLPAEPNAVAMDGQRLAVAFSKTATSPSGFRTLVDLYDLADEAAPRKIGETVATAGLAVGIGLADDQVMVTLQMSRPNWHPRTWRVDHIDLRDPSAPTWSADVDVGPETRVEFGAEGRLLLSSIGTSFFYHRGFSIRVVDPSAIDDASAQASFRSLASSIDLLTRGSRAYVAASSGLHAFELDGAQRPRQVGVVPESAQCVAEGGGIVFAASGTQLRAYDFSEAADPRLIGQLELVPREGKMGRAPEPMPVRNMVYRDGLLYIVGLARALEIVDVRQPAAMRTLGSIFIDSNRATYHRDGFADLELIGDTALVYDWENDDLYALDIADPAQPTILVRIDGDLHQHADHVWLIGRMARIGSRLYVANTADRLQTFDISEPRAPVDISDRSPLQDWWARGVASTGTELWTLGFATHAFGLADEARPARIGWAPGYATGIAFHGQEALVAGLDGLTVYAPNPRPFRIYLPLLPQGVWDRQNP